MKLVYRRDLDGLRSIAVLLVLIFHAGVPTISAGYVGVDIFFVLSGYLVTSILLAEIEGKNFSYTTFYERRIRRLMPPLIPLTVFVFIFCYFFFLPDDFHSTLTSIVAWWTYWSNWYFMYSSGYFSASQDTIPLLHTWSLSIEEQYYLFFPAFLVLMKRLGRKPTLIATLALFFGSLGFSYYATLGNDPASGYLNTFARVHELMLGSLLAQLPAIKLSGRPSVAARFIGMTLMIAPAFYLDKHSAFPGLHALVPTIGTALMIIGDPDSRRDPINLLLSSSLLVYIGKISYGLYLWHWPMLVFSRYLFVDAGALEIIIAVALAFLAAILSYHLLESPIRTRKALKTAPQLAGVLVGCSLFVVLLLAIDTTTNWFDARFSPQVRTAIHLSETRESLGCRNVQLSEGLEGCFYSDNQRPDTMDLVIWGDSLAVAGNRIAERLTENGYRVAMFSTPSCPPLVESWKGNDPKKQCAETNESIIDYISASNADVVIISALTSYVHRYDGPHRLLFQGREVESEEDAQRNFEDAFALTADRLGDRRLTVIGQQPQFPRDIDQYVIANAVRRTPLDSLLDFDSFSRSRATFEATVSPRALYIDASRAFCDEKMCAYEKDGVPLYYDTIHLNILGLDAWNEIVATTFFQHHPKYMATRVKTVDDRLQGMLAKVIVAGDVSAEQVDGDLQIDFTGFNGANSGGYVYFQIDGEDKTVHHELLFRIHGVAGESVTLGWYDGQFHRRRFELNGEWQTTSIREEAAAYPVRFYIDRRRSDVSRAAVQLVSFE